MGTPKSVAFINRLALFGKLSMGTIFNTWVTAMRETYTAIRDMHDVAIADHAVLADLRAVLVEKTDFQPLGNATVIQNTGGGGATEMEISAGFDYMIDGAIYSKAATQDIAVGAGADTGAAEYKAITLAVNAAGAVSITYSAAAAAAPVTPPAPGANTCPFATAQIPNNFTNGATNFLTAWVTNGWSAQDAPSVALGSTVTATKPATSVPVLPDKNV